MQKARIVEPWLTFLRYWSGRGSAIWPWPATHAVKTIGRKHLCCTTCGGLLLGTYYEVEAARYCLACVPRCSQCSTYGVALYEDDGQRICRTCRDARYRCVACDGPLGDTFYRRADLPGPICATCATMRKTCDGCGWPILTNAWTLADGRVHCDLCYRTGVFDLGHAHQLLRDTAEALCIMPGMMVPEGLGVRLRDRNEMRRVVTAGDGPPGFHYGFFVRTRAFTGVDLLVGLPLLVARATLAHELAHAWYAFRCGPLEDLDEETREGFAEWVAHVHLRALGCVKGAERLLLPTSQYRPALERFLGDEHRHGAASVIARMAAHARNEPTRRD